jgi:hypothetical protein
MFIIDYERIKKDIITKINFSIIYFYHMIVQIMKVIKKYIFKVT